MSSVFSGDALLAIVADLDGDRVLKEVAFVTEVSRRGEAQTWSQS